MLVDGIALRERIFRDLSAMMPAGRKSVTRQQLESYTIDGWALPLIDGQQAIHNPSNPVLLDATLSVYTKPGSRYADGSSRDGVWRYAYTGDKPGGRNRKLERANELGLPIIFYDWIAPGVFCPLFPVQVVEYDRDDASVVLEAPGLEYLGSPLDDTPLERAYREQVRLQREHQDVFRERVLFAYRERCTVCGLPDARLLDAAHIRPDNDPDGQPWVENGLALCSIHHRAYDCKVLGIDGDYRLHVRPETMALRDGPILTYGIQELVGRTLVGTPGGKQRPDPYRLDKTYKEYLDSIEAAR